jgi:hypothetical protein
VYPIRPPATDHIGRELLTEAPTATIALPLWVRKRFVEGAEMVATLFAFWLGGVVPQAQALDYGQPSAALWKDQLFVSTTKRHFITAGYLYRGTFSPALRRVRSPVEYRNPSGYGPGSTQAKIDVRADRLLVNAGAGGMYYILPFEVLPELEANEFGLKLSFNAGHAGSPLPHGARFDYLLFPTHRKHDVPLSGIDKDPGDKSPEETYWRNARFDVQIGDEKTVWLFHAYEDTLFVSVEPDYVNKEYLDKKGDPKKKLRELPDRQLRTGKLPVGLTETFAAYTSGGRGYLVTPNGKVYTVAVKDETQVHVSAVWNEPERKIVGVVQDQANDTVYGWGLVTDTDAPERFYVKFDPKPVAVEYKRTVPLWEDRSDAYLESYECARAFRKANEKK